MQVQPCRAVCQRDVLRGCVCRTSFQVLRTGEVDAPATRVRTYNYRYHRSLSLSPVERALNVRASVTSGEKKQRSRREKEENDGKGEDVGKKREERRVNKKRRVRKK